VFTVAVAAVVFILPGCGGGDDGPDAGPPALTLGTGFEGFEPLADGADVWIIQGPQGGFHFIGSIRASGIETGNPDDLRDPSNPTTEFSVFRGTDRVDLGAANYTQGLDPVAGTSEYEMIGRLVILDIQADDELDGVELRFDAEVVDANGVRVTDTRTVVGVPHPANL